MDNEKLFLLEEMQQMIFENSGRKYGLEHIRVRSRAEAGTVRINNKIHVYESVAKLVVNDLTQAANSKARRKLKK